MKQPVDILAEIEPHAGDAPALTPPELWVEWSDAFSPSEIGGTLRAHSRATGIPTDLVATIVAGRVAGALARIEAWSLALTGCSLMIAPEELRVGVTDGEVGAVVDLSRARVVEPDYQGSTSSEPSAAAGLAIDTTIREMVVRGAAATGVRVPSRVVAAAALFAAYAALREIRPRLDGHEPLDVLRRQWRSAWPLDRLTRVLEFAADTDRTAYLARSVCCLEYRCDSPGERRYCTSCPLVDPGRLRVRLESGVTAGGRRPFGPDALRRPPALRRPDDAVAIMSTRTE